jgi:hypothetical protein
LNALLDGDVSAARIRSGASAAPRWYEDDASHGTPISVTIIAELFLEP